MLIDSLNRTLHRSPILAESAATSLVGPASFAWSVRRGQMANRVQSVRDTVMKRRKPGYSAIWCIMASNFGIVISGGGKAKRLISAKLIAIVMSIVLVVEIGLLWLLPRWTRQFDRQIKRAELLETTGGYRSRARDASKMLPPVTGQRYRIQVMRTHDNDAEKIFGLLAGRSNVERLRLMKEANVGDSLPQLLSRCFDGNADQQGLEKFLITSAIAGDLDFAPWVVYSNLYGDYFGSAERAEHAGFVEDARRLYSRFLELGQLLSRGTFLSENVEVQRELNRAEVRLLVLEPQHAFFSRELKEIETTNFENVTKFVNARDPRVGNLARFTAASLAWHNGERDKALQFLAHYSTECGVLLDYCEFLLSKVVDSMEARQESTGAFTAEGLLHDLTERLSDDHPLLDDVYLHWSMMAVDRGNPGRAVTLLSEAARRCPHSDRLYSITARIRAGGQAPDQGDHE
jgi:hypothetical protein